jgi:hypothetical protein
MFPSACSLELHSDSQGALAGIAAYERECNERQRLRMSARPLLQLIHHLMAVRQRAGGAVTLHHVKAHTQNGDVHSVGNRLSDYQANLARLRPDRPRPLALQELPLDRCEHRMCMWTELGAGPMLIDDIRRAAVAQLKAQALARWEAKPDQGYFACAAMLQLGRAVLRSGSPSLQAAFVHVATNSIHLLWLKAAHGPDALQSLRCGDAACDQPLTLAHLAECNGASATGFRASLQHSIVRALSRERCASAWLRSNRALLLPACLLKLFPVAADVNPAERLRHLTRVMCGAFSRAQENAATRALGFPSAEEGRPTLLRLRLLCLEHVQQLFSDLKKAACS